jgi:glycosyltransferase involved in cell wall biosynthesis
MTSVKRTVLLMAYAISPVRGSEYSVAWNYIKAMSSDVDLIVLYGMAGDHMGELDEIQSSQEAMAMTGVEWVAVQPNSLAKILNYPNRKGFWVYSFYLAYRVWHFQAYKKAEEIVGGRRVDIVHYLCPIGYREPGYLGRLRKPLIWGPIGGVDNRSLNFALRDGLVRFIKVASKNLVNGFQFHWGRRTAQAFRRADVLMSSTVKTQELIKQVHGVHSFHMPENCLTDDMLANQSVRAVSAGGVLEIIWVGRIDEAKALDLLLHALAPLAGQKWALTVVGDGPKKPACMALSEALGLTTQVRWTGRLQRDMINDYYRKSHIHVVSSLYEANPTVIWEAMSFGVPTLTLAHFGMSDNVCNRCGVKVDVKGEIADVVGRITSAIKVILGAPETIEALSIGVAQCTERFTWRARRENWKNYYDQAEKAWASKKSEALR